MTVFLAEGNVIAIHRELIERFGGRHGIRDRALLQSAVGRCRSGYYADCVEAASALMESLGINHPFIDGNKRVAVTSAFVFLELNGNIAAFDDDEAYGFIVGMLETHDYTRARIDLWIRERLCPLERIE